MTRISEQKIKRIKEDILSLLYHNSPKSLFVAYIAKELARDEEFIKRLLLELQQEGISVGINKNAKGIEYRRRIRWRLSNKAYQAYKDLEQGKLSVN